MCVQTEVSHLLAMSVKEAPLSRDSSTGIRQEEPTTLTISASDSPLASLPHSSGSSAPDADERPHVFQRSKAPENIH